MSVGRTLYVAEPPAIYMVRPPLVVDCSVLIAVLFEEDNRALAAELMANKSRHAPYLLDHEIASVAQKKSRNGCSPAMVAQALADYAMQEITLYPTAIQAQYQLAQRYNLSAYDAAYLWLAAELKAPLATFDEKLGTAAKAHLATLP